MPDVTDARRCANCGEWMILSPVLVCGDCGTELTFRSFTYTRGGKYYAECIDMNIVERGDTEEQAISKLQEAMFLYIETALEGNTKGLIPRKSPLSHRIRYHLNRLFRHRHHSGHLPVPTGGATVETRFSHCP